MPRCRGQLQIGSFWKGSGRSAGFRISGKTTPRSPSDLVSIFLVELVMLSLIADQAFFTPLIDDHNCGILRHGSTLSGPRAKLHGSLFSLGFGVVGQPCLDLLRVLFGVRRRSRSAELANDSGPRAVLDPSTGKLRLRHVHKVGVVVFFLPHPVGLFDTSV